MKIKRMTASFGGLEGARLELGPGLNVIQAPNEGGKSTWAGFLKAMLYGIDTRDRDRKGYLADKNRYQPWSGAPMEGELVLECWADSPEFVAGVKHLYFDGGKTDAGVVSSRVHKGRLLLKLRGVDTVEQGDALRGKVLYLNREDVRLEAGQVFLQDLIGLKAIDGTTGREYGVLQEVLPTGANDVYRIVDGAGKEYLFPAVKHMIQEISLEEGVIRLLPIPGIFDQEGEEA